MKQKAFTLIELLVVVAIIGILAAVGVVAYNGYTGAAKASATQTNHKLVSNYIQNELKKCDLGESNIMASKGASLRCNGLNSASVISYIVAILTILHLQILKIYITQILINRRNPKVLDNIIVGYKI